MSCSTEQVIVKIDGDNFTTNALFSSPVNLKSFSGTLIAVRRDCRAQGVLEVSIDGHSATGVINTVFQIWTGVYLTVAI